MMYELLPVLYVFGYRDTYKANLWRETRTIRHVITMACHQGQTLSFTFLKSRHPDDLLFDFCSGSLN